MPHLMLFHILAVLLDVVCLVVGGESAVAIYVADPCGFFPFCNNPNCTDSPCVTLVERRAIRRDIQALGQALSDVKAISVDTAMAQSELPRITAKYPRRRSLYLWTHPELRIGIVGAHPTCKYYLKGAETVPKAATRSAKGKERNIFTLQGVI